MVGKFKTILINEIKVMVENSMGEGKTHSRVNSGQSNLGLSIISDSSGHHPDAYDIPASTDDNLPPPAS
jgi:hypothetical protein